MDKVQYNLKHKEILDTFLLKSTLVKPGKTYGYPAYYIGGKLFASLYQDGVCGKIPIQRVKELLKVERVAPFQPMGRKMKEWILIVHENSKDYLKDIDIFQESIKYIKSLTKN